jgi:hypothetical protein
MNERRISRRTVLKGLGGVTIGLPLLEEMLVSPAAAAPQAGGGAGAGVQRLLRPGHSHAAAIGRLHGVLEPLKPLADKLLILRNVDQVRATRKGSTPTGTARPPPSPPSRPTERPGRAARRSTRSSGRRTIPTACPAAWSRRWWPAPSSAAWTAWSGTSTASTTTAPPRHDAGAAAGAVRADLRHAPVAEGMATDPRSEAVAAERAGLGGRAGEVLHRRTLAAGLGVQGAAGRPPRPHPRIRAAGLRNGGADRPAVPAPKRPATRAAHGGEADPGGEGIDITLDELIPEWRLLADLYALAIQCDRARFGSITFLAAGERIRLKGKYEYDGRTVFQFDDGGQRKKGGAGCSHEWWHEFNESKKNEQLAGPRPHQDARGGLLPAAAGGPESREANGKTILENSLITISTESGDGRHTTT